MIIPQIQGVLGIWGYVIVCLQVYNNQLMCFYPFRASMANSHLMDEIKWHTIIVVIHAKHNDVENACFLEVTISFRHKGRMELEASSGNVLTAAKCKEYSWLQNSYSGSRRLSMWILEHSSGSLPVISRYLRSQSTMWCMRTFGTSHMWWEKGKFMPAHTQWLLQVKCLLNKMKPPEETSMFWVFVSDKKMSTRIKKWTGERPDAYMQILLMPLPCHALMWSF